MADKQIRNDDGLSFNKVSDVDNWLKTVGKHFIELSDDNKNRTLDYLIQNSGAKQLYHLSEKLNCLLKRDFLKLLPPEMSFYLLKFLDPKSLLACCQVSRYWNKTVNSCVDCWKRSCEKIGVKITDGVTSAKEYKKLFTTVYARQINLDNGTAFTAEYLHGHTDRVMAIYYHNGLLATGSDDRTVRLWDCETGQCLKIYNTHTVADVKFDSKQLVTASFDNTAACWDLATGVRMRHYRGHVGAVFTVDFNEDVDILVTGGIDYTIKIWMFSEALLLHSLNTYNAGWITKVLIHRADMNSKQFSIVCIDFSYIYVWNIAGHHKVSDFKGWPAAHSCFVPTLLKHGQDLYCCVSDIQHSIFSIQKNSLVESSASDVQPVLYPKAGIQAMLGIGDQFRMFLSDAPVDHYKIDIVNHNSKRLCSIKLPDCRPTKRGSTFTLGERGWFDGFDGVNDKGVFFAASLRDHSIYMLKWKPRCNKQEVGSLNDKRSSGVDMSNTDSFQKLSVE
ncbi:FBXW2 [Bugula neritina]|uniref:FBXW2 n=1 Tax=Bugula neritina TaxID=10212 RepID=A0A7J7KTS6_BUGNE|nr:FBXW2 [Bugula neritina]